MTKQESPQGSHDLTHFVCVREKKGGCKIPAGNTTKNRTTCKIWLNLDCKYFQHKKCLSKRPYPLTYSVQNTVVISIHCRRCSPPTIWQEERKKINDCLRTKLMIVKELSQASKNIRHSRQWNVNQTYSFLSTSKRRYLKESMVDRCRFDNTFSKYVSAFAVY